MVPVTAWLSLGWFNIYLPRNEVSCTLSNPASRWWARSSPDWAVRVRALAGKTVLCSWARHFTLTVPLSTQVYKWVPANLMLGVTLRWTSISSRGGVERLLIASCYRNRDKLRPDRPLGSCAVFTFTLATRFNYVAQVQSKWFYTQRFRHISWWYS